MDALTKIANYFKVNNGSEDSPKLEMTCDELKEIVQMHRELCMAKSRLARLQFVVNQKGIRA